jgi:homoserine trans-succinylase
MKSIIPKRSQARNTSPSHASLFGAQLYRGADKSLARPTSRCILFDGENISFYASLDIYINSTNIPLIMIINRTYENQNLLSL